MIFKPARAIALAALLVQIGSLDAFSSEKLQSTKFSDVKAKALREAGRHGPDEVLMVYDIDNTVLKANQDLGSDQWFIWQSNLIAEHEKSPQKKNEIFDYFAVASNIGGLLDALGTLYSLAEMQPTEKDAPGIVRSLIDQGFPTLFLTARGMTNRDATIRELKRNGYITEVLIPAIGGKYDGHAYLPFNAENPQEYFEDEATFKKLGLNQDKYKPRPVTYMDGVFMGSGQHKGAMLRALIGKHGAHPKTIIFVDDTAKNIKAMQEAFERFETHEQQVNLITYQYDHEKAAIEGFVKEQEDIEDTKKGQGGKKGLAKRQWDQLKKVHQVTFPKTPVSVPQK